MEFLKKLWRGWMRFGHFMGDIVGRVVMTLFYFTLLLPFGVIITLFGDPLDMKHKTKRRRGMRAPRAIGIWKKRGGNFDAVRFSRTGQESGA